VLAPGGQGREQVPVLAPQALLPGGELVGGGGPHDVGQQCVLRPGPRARALGQAQDEHGVEVEARGRRERPVQDPVAEPAHAAGGLVELGLDRSPEGQRAGLGIELVEQGEPGQGGLDPVRGGHLGLGPRRPSGGAAEEVLE